MESRLSRLPRFSNKQGGVAKKLNQEPWGDSKIPVYVTRAKTSSLPDVGHRIQFNEQQTALKLKQPPINSSVAHSKPNATFSVSQSSNDRSGHCKRNGHCLKEEMPKAAEKDDDETETQTAESFEKNDIVSSNRVLELKHNFEAVGEEQGKKKPDLDAFSTLQPSTSNGSPYRKWTSTYPRSALDLSNQKPSTVKQKNEALCSQECLKEEFKFCENSHESLHERQETRQELLRIKRRTTSTYEQFLENEYNNKTNSDSGGEMRNCKREAIETNSSESPLSNNRTKQTSRVLDQPRVMDGVINPVSRVHSEPLTHTSLFKKSRAESPRRRIFETRSDKMVSHAANSDRMEGKGCVRNGALYKQRNECRAEVHRSSTDHRAEGTRMVARNKYVDDSTATFNDSIESHKWHQQNDDSVHCSNFSSRQEQGDLVGGNSLLSGVVEDNEAMQISTEAQVNNIDKQKQSPITDSTSVMSSPSPNGRLLSLLPLPLSSDLGFETNAEQLQYLAHSREYPETADRYFSRPDCSSYHAQLTKRSTYGSDGDFYVSSKYAGSIQIRDMASNYSFELSPSDVVQSESQKKTPLAFDSELPVDSSLHCVQPKLLSPFQSPIKPDTNQSKTADSCEFSESKLGTTEVATNLRLACCSTTGNEVLTDQMVQTIRRDDSLLQRQSKTSLKAAQHDLPTAFRVKSCRPNRTAEQSSANILEDHQLIDKLEVNTGMEFVKHSHHGQIGQNEEMISCASSIDLLEDLKPTEQPVRNSLMSVKPASGFMSMYRTYGPIRAKFSDRVKTAGLIDSKIPLFLPTNTSSQKRDLYQPQTVILETCKPIMNLTKPSMRSDSSSKPLMRLAADKGDEHVRKCDNRRETVFRQQPSHRWAKMRHKEQISPYLRTSYSTDSITTDCELDARSLNPQVQHSRYALRRRKHSDLGSKVINTTASTYKDDRASSFGSPVNFRHVRQQLAEEQDERGETSSVEEVLKSYNHPLLLSESEFEIDCNNDRNGRYNEETVTLPANTRNGETELIEQERTEIIRQTQNNQNRMLFQGIRILQFRQRVSLMFIGIIFILVFYLNIFPIFQSTLLNRK